jgi:uncharacterized protein (TIGR03435 family)
MMQGPMLQALLEDRFKLKIRYEAREVPVYALTVAKGGLKLRRAEEGSCIPIDYASVMAGAGVGAPSPQPQKPLCGNGGFGRTGNLVVADIPAISIDDFSKRLSGRLDRPVIDRTGLHGMYDIHLQFAPDQVTPRLTPGGGDLVFGGPADPADPTGGPSIFTAVQEQLGLKLEPTKGPGEFLVIDGAEKPSGN